MKPLRTVILSIYTCLLFFCRQISCDLKNNSFAMAKNSSTFVDKTGLLKSIYRYNHIVLTAPQKFGKTINIQMIKLFLGNHNRKDEVTELFENTIIWKDKTFRKEHFCNHPVIHCTFKPKIEVRTVKDVIKELKVNLRDSFLEHKYLLNSTKLDSSQKYQYKNYCHGDMTEHELGLKVLSEMLYHHHGKKVVLLVDDYDFIITYSIFKRDLDTSEGAEALFRIMDNAINLNDVIERSVFTGRLPFKLGVQFCGLYLLEHFRFMTTKEFTPYFGFTAQETERLLKKHRLGNRMGNVTQWYGGYSYLRGDFMIYNPWSVLSYMKTKNFYLHWIPERTRDAFHDYIEPHYALAEDVTKLSRDEGLTIQAIRSLTTYEVEKLKDVQFASYSYGENSEDHLFLQVLLESGYLTYAEKYVEEPLSTKVKFPNLEVKISFEQVLARIAETYPDINRYDTSGSWSKLSF